MRMIPVLLLALFLVAATVYGPLGLSVVESKVCGTDHVEDFFRTIGLHDALSWIYEKTIPGI